MNQINTNMTNLAKDLIPVQNFRLQMEAWKNVIIFAVDLSSSVHFDNKNKDILIIGEEPTQGLDDTTLTAETRYHIIFIGLLTGIVSPSTHTK